VARSAEQHYNSGTMEIFISWHGKRSHAVAVALRDWLPLIVNAFKPWLSSADIDKGARWRTELAAKLGSVTAGIFCLTPTNLTAPWLIYEAGAISRTPEKTYVCTLLVDLQPSDVKDPLAQFQATKTTKEDIHQLVKNLNKALGEPKMDDALVDRAFEKWWPDLEEELKNLPSDETTLTPRRSDRDLLEELVDIARATKADATATILLSQMQSRYSELTSRVADMQMTMREEAEIFHHRLQDELLSQRAQTARAIPDLDKALEDLRRQIVKLTQSQATQPTGIDDGKS
jgi:TIR domain-containing protein